VIAPVDVTVLLPVEVVVLHLLAAVEATIPLARTTVVIATMIDATATVPAVLTIEIETLRTIGIDAMKTAKMVPTAMTEKVGSLRPQAHLDFTHRDV
jgi:hypothetical protein